MNLLKDIGKAAIPGLASAGTGYLLDKLVGPSDSDILAPLNQARGVANAGFAGGGLTGSRVGDRFQVSGSPQRNAIISGMSGSLNDQAREFAALRSKWGSGTSDLRKSLFQEVDNNSRRTISDLKDNLARRKVAGSSFAADAIARAQNEFNQERNRIGQQLGLIELQAQQDLIGKQYQSTVTSYNAALQELNLQGDAAIKLATQGQAAISNLAGIQSELLAQSAGGTFELVAPGVQQAVQGGIGALFS